MKPLATFVALALFLCAPSAFTAVSDTDKEQADSLLELSEEAVLKSTQTHAPWGLPQPLEGTTEVIILTQHEYIMGYHPTRRVAMWATYKRTKEDLDSDLTRQKYFRADPRLEESTPGASSTPSDYKEPVFDQGHIVPSADMKRSISAMLNTYILTNMAPQHKGFNQQTMRWTEEFIRGWAQQREAIWIITGSIFDEDENGKNDQTPPTHFTKEEKRVAVPTHFYKVLLWKDKTSGFIDSLEILLEHTEDGHKKWDTDDYLEENITTIDDIENRIGHDLLPALPDAKEDALEIVKAEALWNIVGRK